MPTNSAQARLSVAAITNFEKRVEDGQSDPHVEVTYWRNNDMFNTGSHGTSIRWQAVTARQTTSGFSRETRTDFVRYSQIPDI